RHPLRFLVVESKCQREESFLRPGSSLRDFRVLKNEKCGLRVFSIAFRNSLGTQTVSFDSCLEWLRQRGCRRVGAPKCCRRGTWRTCAEAGSTAWAGDKRIR